jgi:hypothetical protein
LKSFRRRDEARVVQQLAADSLFPPPRNKDAVRQDNGQHAVIRDVVKTVQQEG